MRKQTVKSIQKAAMALAAAIEEVEKDIRLCDAKMLEDMTGVEQSGFICLHRRAANLSLAHQILKDIISV